VILAFFQQVCFSRAFSKDNNEGNWLKKNKLITALGAACGVGCGVVLFLVSAKRSLEKKLEVSEAGLSNTKQQVEILTKVKEQLEQEKNSLENMKRVKEAEMQNQLNLLQGKIAVGEEQHQHLKEDFEFSSQELEGLKQGLESKITEMQVLESQVESLTTILTEKEFCLESRDQDAELQKRRLQELDSVNENLLETIQQQAQGIAATNTKLSCATTKIEEFEFLLSKKNYEKAVIPGEKSDSRPEQSVQGDFALTHENLETFDNEQAE
jgi:chromosome segregation ATPase